MAKWKKNKSLKSIYLYNTLLISVLLGIMVAAIFIFFEVRAFNEDAARAREQGLAAKKQKVKSEVEKVIDYIHFSRLFMEKRMKSDLKSRVYEAWSIINNIYNKQKDQYSDEQILNHIKQALRPIRFYNGRGYYFIVRLNGVEELYPVQPEFEGKNLMNLKDERGNYVIKDEVKIAKGQGEGFVKGYWRKPHADSLKTYAKTSFVKVFKPLNIYVGTGDYLDNVKKDIQEKAKLRIKRTEFGKYGYVFVNTYTGVAVVIDSDKYSEGDTVWELEDPNGVKVIQEEWKAVNRPGGGFIRYHWKKPGTDKIAPKISYIKGVDEWQWMIGAGVYTDEIEANIAKERQLLYKRMLRKGGAGVFIILIVVLALFYIAHRNTQIIRRNLDVFIANLRYAVRQGGLMRTEEYNLSDLQNILPPINEMLQNKAIAEKRVKESEVRFRTIFENVPIMLLVFDENGNNKFKNKEFDRVFGVDEKQEIHHFYLLRFVKNSSKSKTFLNNLSSSDGVFREIDVSSADGSTCHNWACFKTAHQEIILAGFDISPLLTQQKKLIASNETKDKVLSVISHDLHGPFNTIIGFSKLLLSSQGKLSDKKQQRYLEHIHTSSKSMHTMLANLLSWARAQSGNIKLSTGTTDVHNLTEEVNRTLSPLAAQKRIVIYNKVEYGLMVETDASLLRIIIQNLVANGIKFTEQNGQIVINTQRIANMNVEIIVSDTGVGMEPEMVRRFNEGGKVESKKGTKNESGTGLGLLICKEFSHYLNGNIKVKSQQNKGTSFILTLPHGKVETQKNNQ